MRANATFDDIAVPPVLVDRATVDDNAQTVVADATEVAPPGATAASATVGRTVLPRIEREGSLVRLVHEDKERYATAEKLGEGGMGEVRLAHDQDIGRPVAIKRLHKTLKTGGLSRFVGEIRTVGALEHPNIVPIHDVGIEPDGSYFFVMKYVEGETVEDIITRLKAGDPEARRAYPIERRLQIVRGVLHALEYAHARGVVHRDVKPANVMVGKHGEVMLMDWGIARNRGLPEPESADGTPAIAPTSTTATRQGTVMGTPAYMSPEQFLGEIDKIDGRSDLYSLGVMLFELISLRNATSSAPSVEACKALVLGRESVADGLNLEPGAGFELAWLAHRATLRDRDQRFASAGAMLDEMDAIADGRCRADCIFTATKRASTAPSRFVDHHPFVAVAVALGIVATGATGALATIATLIALAVT